MHTKYDERLDTCKTEMFVLDDFYNNQATIDEDFDKVKTKICA